MSVLLVLWDAHDILLVYQTHGDVYVWHSKRLLLSMFDDKHGSKSIYGWRCRLIVVSMFDAGARAHLCLTLPGWLLHLCLMPQLVVIDVTITQCNVEINGIVAVLVVVAAIAQHMIWNSSCTIGLVVNIWCCCSRFLVVFVAVVRHEVENGVRLRTRPCCCHRCARWHINVMRLHLRPCHHHHCRTQRINVMCLHTRPCHCRHCMTWCWKCCVLAHKALLSPPLCDATYKCCALAHEALSLLFLCNMTLKWCALAHKTLLLSPSFGAMWKGVDCCWNVIAS